MMRTSSILAVLLIATVLVSISSASVSAWTSCDQAAAFGWKARWANVACYLEIKNDLFGGGWENSGDMDGIGGANSVVQFEGDGDDVGGHPGDSDDVGGSSVIGDLDDVGGHKYRGGYDWYGR